MALLYFIICKIFHFIFHLHDPAAVKTEQNRVHFVIYYFVDIMNIRRFRLRFKNVSTIGLYIVHMV